MGVYPFHLRARQSALRTRRAKGSKKRFVPEAHGDAEIGLNTQSLRSFGIAPTVENIGGERLPLIQRPLAKRVST